MQAAHPDGTDTAGTITGTILSHGLGRAQTGKLSLSQHFPFIRQPPFAATFPFQLSLKLVQACGGDYCNVAPLACRVQEELLRTLQNLLRKPQSLRSVGIPENSAAAEARSSAGPAMDHGKRAADREESPSPGNPRPLCPEGKN